MKNENKSVQDVCNEVANEVTRARTLHKPFNSLHEAWAVLLEEVDELWEQVKINPRKLSASAVRRRQKKLREEAIQVAAMGVRTVLDCELA